MGISLGNLTLADPVILAPMSGVSDYPFRRTVARFGVGLVVSEMIASEAMVRQTREYMKKASNDCASEFPMAVQLAGHDPEITAEAARLNEARGAALIDLNFGCPNKKVVRKVSGSALMRDEAHAARIFEAVVGAVGIPVTLKMRTGWDEAERNAPRLARIAEECGIRMITVHGRTRCQFFEGRADWRFVARVKEATTLPVVVNGDITDVSSARQALRESGADGVMPGRGCYGRPWLPAQIAASLAGREPVADPSLEERREIVADHYDAMLSHHGEQAGMRIARKHLAWYCRDLAGSDAFRDTVNGLDDPAAVISEIRRFHDMAAENRMAA